MSEAAVMKYKEAGFIALKEVRLHEVVSAGGRVEKVFRKEQGYTMTDIGIGVLLEKEGYDDVIVYPSNLKSSVPLVDIEVVAEPEAVEDVKEVVEAAPVVDEVVVDKEPKLVEIPYEPEPIKEAKPEVKAPKEEPKVEAPKIDKPKKLGRFGRPKGSKSKK